MTQRPLAGAPPARTRPSDPVTNGSAWRQIYPRAKLFLPCPLPSSENDEGGGSAHERFWISCCLVLRFTVGEGCLLSLRLAREVPRTNPPPPHFSCAADPVYPPPEKSSNSNCRARVESGTTRLRFSLVPADKSQGTESGEIYPSNFSDADATANHGTVSALSYPSHSSLSASPSKMTNESYPLWPSHDRPRRKLHR